MAILDGKFIKGAIGNYTFKKVGETQILQGKSALNKKKMTEASLRTASDFGVASNFASQVRLSLSQLIDKRYDGTMIYRFTSAMGYVLRQAKDPSTGNYIFSKESFSRLDGFEFNSKSLLINSLSVTPSTSLTETNLTVQIPAIAIPKQLKFPDEATTCKLVVQLSQFDLVNGFYKDDQVETLTIINKKGETEPHSFSFSVQPGCLCIAGMALQFFRDTSAYTILLNSKSFNPTYILMAELADGTIDPSITTKWYPMDFKA